MYEQYYGLRERPFDMLSNAKYLLLTPKHQEALSNLDFGLSGANGITLLIGEAGTGKTTLLRKALAPYMRRSAARPACWVHLTNPVLKRDEFLESLAHGFQLSPQASGSKTRLLRELEEMLVQHHEHGIASLLILDEAQSLPNELLEEVRLLANLESETAKLLRVVMAGQPALGTRLNEPGLYQLKQRVGLRCTLSPLALKETSAYIAHRIWLAGGSPEHAFTRDAVLAIHERSGGIPRTVNVICDNALLTGYAAEERPVGPAIVKEVCIDFDLHRQPAAHGLSVVRQAAPQSEGATAGARNAGRGAFSRYLHARSR
jgi:type II secretory pathway predicted ATPase ExeA